MPEGQQTRPLRCECIATDYFKTMGIPVRQGRVFDENDRFDSAPVVIVNERFANKFFPGQNVIGKRIKPGFSADETGEKMREIVGVVGNVKHLALKNDDSPEMYLPRTQIPLDIVSLVVRTQRFQSRCPHFSCSEGAGRDGRDDSAHECPRLRRIHFAFSGPAALQRSPLSIFAGTALLLTAIGIYGVMAYSVSQRTNEIGIRIALGAAQSAIFRLVVGQAMTLVGISLALGLAGAFAATRLLNSLLYGVRRMGSADVRRHRFPDKHCGFSGGVAAG